MEVEARAIAEQGRYRFGFGGGAWLEVEGGFDEREVRVLAEHCEGSGSMLSLGAGARRVYLAVGATDLRKGFDGLYGLVRSRLEEDPMSGQLFVFCNAGRTRVKALYFDGSGLWLCAKRLGRGRFDWPEEIEGVAKVAISATEFAALMDGLELTRTRAKLWWRKKVEQAA